MLKTRRKPSFAYVLDALAVSDYMMPQLEDLDVEEFWALFFNPKHEMLRRVRICRGEVSEGAADPRNIMRFGVLYNTTYFVTVHNHVSGNPSPTKFDSIIAAKLSQAAEAVRMTLRDHIILGDGNYRILLTRKAVLDFPIHTVLPKNRIYTTVHEIDHRHPPHY